MHHRILSRIRANIVAYVALFLALTGTSVAAVGLANHSIDPVKLDPRNIGGYVRAWASVSASGHVTASAGQVTVRTEPGGQQPGSYYFRWRANLTSACTVVGSVDTGSGNSPGYLTADLAAPRRDQPTSIVDSYDSQGQLSPLPFEVELLCATPR